MTVTKNTTHSGVAEAARVALDVSRAQSMPIAADEFAEYKEAMERALAGLLDVDEYRESGSKAMATLLTGVLSEQYALLARIEKKVDNKRRSMGFKDGYLYGVACSANWVKWQSERGASAEQIACHIAGYGIKNDVSDGAPAEDEPGKWADGLARPVVTGMVEQRVLDLLQVVDREKAFTVLSEAAASGDPR
jgi:hypothetical protein